MRKTWYVVPCAGLLAAAGCAGSRGASSQNPTANAVEANQRQSQEALKQAHDAQAKATDQQEQVAAAQQDVQKDQQKLQQDQQKLKQEQQKEQQLQQQANQQTQQSAEQAQQGQAAATTALSRQGQQIANEQATFAGQVTRASGSQLSVKPPSGEPMTFRITNETKVLVDGRQGSLDRVLPGEDARVSYELGGPTPHATSVLIQTGNPALGSQPSGSSGSSTMGTGSSSSSGSSGGTRY